MLKTKPDKTKQDKIANICFAKQRQTTLEKEKIFKLQSLFYFRFSCFYINKQRGDSEKLEKLSGRPKYILRINKLRWYFQMREKLTNVG